MMNKKQLNLVKILSSYYLKFNNKQIKKEFCNLIKILYNVYV